MVLIEKFGRSKINFISTLHTDVDSINKAAIVYTLKKGIEITKG